MADFPGTMSNDTITGTGDADVILDGGDGFDSLAGAGGDDRITVTSDRDTVDGGDGIDTLAVIYTGSGFFQQVGRITNTAGLPSTSTVWVEYSNVERFDLTVAGDSTLAGGADDDVITATSIGGSLFEGLGGDDAISTFGGGNALRGGDGDDWLAASGVGRNTVEGAAGSDRLVATSTLNRWFMEELVGSLATGYASELDHFDSSENNILGFSGIEHFTLTHTGGGGANLATGDGDDSVITGVGNDTIFTGAGIDTVDGGGGIDRWGGDLSFATQDIVIDLNGASSFLGTASVVNVEAFNTLSTGSGDDRLTSTTAVVSETVDAGGGDDIVTLFGGGVDSVDGGEGRDRLVVTSTAGRWFLEGFALTGSLETGYGGEFDHVDSSEGTLLFFNGIEDFSLTHTGPGGATLRTGDGNDSVTTGSGNDVLFTGAGVDTVDGGAGIDRWGADLSAATADIVIDLNGASSFLGTASVVNVEAFNTLSTGSGDDRLTSTTAVVSETVSAGGGDDVVTLFGGGVDSVDGGEGRDRLVVTSTAGRWIMQDILGTLVTGYGGELDHIDSSEGTLLFFTGIEDFSLTHTGPGGADLVTGDGDDSVTTGAGNDTLFTGGGIDTVDGGGGIDRWGGDLSSATQAIVINLNVASTYLGTGSVLNVEGFNTLTTGSGDDVLTSTATNILNETINSGAGSDLVTLFGRGVDSVDAGAGNDRLVVNFPAELTTGVSMSGFSGSLAAGYSGVFNGTGSNDVAFTGVENFTFSYTGAAGVVIALGDGADSLSGNTGADNLNGAGGDDTLNGGAGDDTLSGGLGFDTAVYSGAASAVTVTLASTLAQATGGAGTDTLGGIDALLGSDFADALSGDGAHNQLSGGIGNDTLSGAAGDDTLVGGLGLDSLVGGDGADTGSWEAAAVRVIANLTTGTARTTNFDVDTLAELENLLGSAFNDSLTGDGAANRLSGGLGDDALDGGLGNDTLDGGLGSDTASFATATAAVVLTLNASVQDTGAAGVDTLIGIENLSGSTFDDSLRGDGGNNALNGASGDDFLVGGLGDDTLNGAAGGDTVSYNGSASNGAVTIDLAVTTAQNTGGAGVDTLASIENVVGTGLNDVLRGDTRGNQLRGQGGNDDLDGRGGVDSLFGLAGLDTLRGGDGADYIVGGTDNDLLFGEANNDRLYGEDGDDTITGGLGADGLYGGAGADRFVFASAEDSPAASRDIVRDFDAASGDLIDLSGIDAVEGGDDTAFNVVAAFSGAAGELRLTLYARGRKTLVEGDTDGDGDADFAIVVEAGGLTEADFVL